MVDSELSILAWLTCSRVYHDGMKPCISQATTMPHSFADDVGFYADAGCPDMEVWLTKLENHLAEHGADATQQLLETRQMRLAAAAYQGGLLLSQGEQRKAHFDHFKQRLNLCQQFRIPTLVLVADFVEKVDQTALERSVVSLKQAAQWAAAFDVKLALEFRGSATFCASLDTAVALVTMTEEDNVGICFDVFHYYTGPSKFEDLALLNRNNLAHVHICDVAGISREIASDSDRVLPGDGDYQLVPILDHFRNIGYEGYISLELFNPTLWQANAKQVSEIGITALRKLMGLAENN